MRLKFAESVKIIDDLDILLHQKLHLNNDYSQIPSELLILIHEKKQKTDYYETVSRLFGVNEQ